VLTWAVEFSHLALWLTEGAGDGVVCRLLCGHEVSDAVTTEEMRTRESDGLLALIEADGTLETMTEGVERLLHLHARHRARGSKNQDSEQHITAGGRGEDKQDTTHHSTRALQGTVHSSSSVDVFSETDRSLVVELW
jgi:hypothetical protein